MADTQHIERDNIIDAGIQLFSEHGFQKVTVDMLAECLGCSKPVIYRHFKSKKSIMNAAVRYIYKHLRIRKPTLSEIQVRLQRETPGDILRSYCLMNSAEDFLNRSYYRLLYKEAFTFERLSRVSYYVWLNYYRAMRTVLRSLCRLGAIPRQQDDTLAEMWTRVMFMFSLWQTFDPYCKELGDVTAIFIKIAVQGVERLECGAVTFQRYHTPRFTPENDADKIVGAACELFSISGYEKTTIRGIAAKLQIPPSKIYKHFNGKWELMDRVLEFLRYRDVDQDIFHRYRQTKKLEDLIAALSGSYILYDKFQIERYRIWVDMIYKHRGCRYHCLGRVVEKRIDIKSVIRELVAERPISNVETYSHATIYLFNHIAINIENAMFYRDISLTEKYRIDAALMQASIIYRGLRRTDEAFAAR